MPNEFAEYLAGYLRNQSENYKTYLLTALENKDHCVSIVSSSVGITNESKDLKNFELLCDAKIFTEKTQFSRSGRNMFKIFCLTDLGLKLAEDLKREDGITVPQ
jgi:hypothetical protein